MPNDENKPESNIKSALDAATALVEKVPVYTDAIQPAAKEVGKSLLLIAKTINAVLFPLKGLVWGFEKIEEWLNPKLEDLLKNVPEENIITPAPNVAVPAIEALRYTGQIEELRNLYANLLATAMNKDTLHLAHPAYIEIIKCLTPDEARILKLFKNLPALPLLDIYEQPPNNPSRRVVLNFSLIPNKAKLLNPDLIKIYFDNLIRLRILEISNSTAVFSENDLAPLREDKYILDLEIINGESQIATSYYQKSIYPTSFGWAFINQVVL